MSKSLKILGISLMLTVAMSLLAADAPHSSMGKTWNLNLPSAMKVGGVTLPPGDYKVQDLTEGDNHVLVFKTQSNKEKAHAGCKLEKLDKKVDQTVLISDQDGAGARVLESVAFQGDKFRRELVTP